MAHKSPGDYSDPDESRSECPSTKEVNLSNKSPVYPKKKLDPNQVLALMSLYMHSIYVG